MRNPPRIPLPLVFVPAALAALLASAATAFARPADRDHDRLPDRWERHYKLSTHRKSGRGDPDHDGLSNRIEYRLRVNPRRKDTDGDGLSDGVEVRKLHTNPRRRTTLRRTVRLPEAPAPKPPARKKAPAAPATPAARPAPPAPRPVPAPDRTRAPAGFSGGPAPDLFVDRYSVGGRCDDSRTAAQASSPAAPWCTLGRALAAAPAGATVAVRRGSYPAVSVTGLHRTSALTFRPYGDEPVTMASITTEQASGLRFMGFWITGGVLLQVGTTNVQLVGNDLSPAGIYLRCTRDVLIQDNAIHDVNPGARGLLAQGYWSDPAYSENKRLTIRDNHFARMTYDAIAVYNGAEDLLIEGNDIEEVRVASGSDLHVDPIQTMGGTNMVIRDNLIHDSTHGLLVKDATAKGLVVENNVFTRIVSAAMNIWNAPGARIVSNTVWGTGSGVLIQDMDTVPGATSATVANNILDNLQAPASLLSYEDYNLVARGRYYGAKDSRAAPQFVNQAGLDFHLAPASPGIDAGTSDEAPAFDHSSRGRFDDPAVPNRGGGAVPYYDIGAYEH